MCILPAIVPECCQNFDLGLTGWSEVHVKIIPVVCHFMPFPENQRLMARMSSGCWSNKLRNGNPSKNRDAYRLSTAPFARRLLHWILIATTRRVSAVRVLRAGGRSPRRTVAILATSRLHQAVLLVGNFTFNHSYSPQSTSCLCRNRPQVLTLLFTISTHCTTIVRRKKENHT